MTPGHHHSLGLALRDQNKLAEANAAFDKAIELFRKAPDLTSATRYWNLGVVLRDKGELDDAIAAFRKAIDIAPNTGWRSGTSSTPCVPGAGRTRPSTCTARPSRPIRKTHNHHLDLGAALAQQKKLDEAIAVYRKIIELAPTSNSAAAAYFGIGNALHRQKKLPEAIAAYYRSIELDPNTSWRQRLHQPRHRPARLGEAGRGRRLLQEGHRIQSRH